MKRITIIFFSCSLLFSCKGIPDPVISADFPGGNILLDSISGDTLWLKPELHENAGQWFYWNFRVAQAGNRELHFRFNLENPLSNAGPAYSRDRGETWNWLGKGEGHPGGFVFSFGPGDSIVQFCTAIPYTQAHLDAFLHEPEPERLIRRDVLCRSNGGRDIEVLYIAPEEAPPAYKVLLTARHHACEMMASWVLEGCMEALVSDPGLDQLRSKVEFMIVPFVDKDGVEKGEQGKNRQPLDHNRDYNDISLYSSTAKLRERVPEWAGGKLRVALDLHCPWIKGENNEWIYLVGNPNEAIGREQARFSELLEKEARGSLDFRASDFLPYGEAWNNNSNYEKGENFAGWAGKLEGVNLASTIEFPYALVLDTMVTKEAAREFGQELAYTLQAYLFPQ